MAYKYVSLAIAIKSDTKFCCWTASVLDLYQRSKQNASFIINLLLCKRFQNGRES